MDIHENSYLPLRVEESLSAPASRTSSTGDEMHGGAAGTRAASPDGLLKKKSLRPELRTTTAMARSKSRLSSRRAALNSAISAKPRELEGKLTHLTNYPPSDKKLRGAGLQPPRWNYLRPTHYCYKKIKRERIRASPSYELHVPKPHSMLL